ncbi:MAG TPA: hypothetical protein VGP26_02375 [Actinophytocola sp.]|jgi:hypothetical protein|nr:hypothetical protein [Actinophytocola sp.]
MSDGPKIDVCIGIEEDCAIGYMITREYDEIDFHFGGPFDGFHYIFDVTALQRFRDVAGKALEELAAARAELADASCG